MVFSLGLGVIYLFNLYSTVPSYFGYLKKFSPQALTALPRRAASGSELPHVVNFRLFPSRVPPCWPGLCTVGAGDLEAVCTEASSM